MSHPLSEQTEVHPNESVSEVSAFAVNENEENEEDIYDESFTVPPGSSSEFRSRNSKAYPTITHLARCPSLLAGHFKMTLETLNEEKRLLKALTILVIQAKHQGIIREFIYRFEAKIHENRKETSWNMFHETVKTQ